MKCKDNLWLYVKCGSVSNVVVQENPHIAKFESLLYSRPKFLGRLFVFSRTYHRLSKTTVDNTTTAGYNVVIVTMT